MPKLIRTIISFLDLIFAYLFLKVKPRIKALHRKFATSFWRNRIKNIGSDCYFNGSIFISCRSSIVIGNNVHIGDKAYLKTEGGLYIGDSTHISRNLTVYTVNHNYRGNRLPYGEGVNARPVFIGRNVWIGMNVSITPGVKIGDGAIIGMGAVIDTDVPELAIKTANDGSINKYRSVEHYHSLVATKSFGGVNGKRVVSQMALNGLELGEGLFFVVSTGRSGSTTIANILNAVDGCTCQHEPRHQLIRLSSEYLHKQKVVAEVVEELKANFIDCSKYSEGQVYGESDQKYANLISQLATLLPKAKFIWLIRSAEDVVASTYGRGWFDDFEFGYSDEPQISKFAHDKWSKYRPNGHAAKCMTEAEWLNMSSFERNCWYWAFWNSLIEEQLTELENDRKLFFKLEDMNDKSLELIEFLDLNDTSLDVRSYNVAAHGRHKKADWDESQRLAFQRWCQPLMDKWYGDKDQ